jgi:hypothetical protein
VLVRTLVSILYVVAVVVSLVLQFFYPFLGVILFYGIIGWFILSLWVYRWPVMSHQIGRRRPAPTASGSAPLPSPASPGNPGSAATENLGFCLYCGTTLEPGTLLCPNCGRSVPP